MSLFDNLIIISFLLAVSLAVFSNFLYKKWLSCSEEIEKIKHFNEETFEMIQNLSEKISQYRIITEQIETKQRNLNESFQKLEDSFQILKETATELQSAHQTKKAVLDFMKR